MSDVEQLSGSELLALAALLRTAIRQDGAFSDDERAILSRIALAVGSSEGGETPASMSAFRQTSRRTGPIGEAGLYELLDLAGTELPNDDAIKEAVRAVTRQDARETIYGLVFEIASSDTVQHSENRLLDWLVEEWELRIETLDTSEESTR